MALIGCERCGRTGPPKIEQKVAPPTQEIAQFLQGTLGRRFQLKKRGKNFFHIL